MAVMDTLHQNAGLEEETQPVPSSEKMALDIHVNGTNAAEIDESNRETAQNDSVPQQLNGDAPDVALDAPLVDANNSAVADNSDLFPSSPEVAKSAASPKPGAIGDSNGVHAEEASGTLSADDQKADAPQPDPKTTTVDPTSAEAQIASASEIDTTSTQPPLVNAPESDLRENPVPVKPEEAASLQDEKRELDANNDADLARTTQETDNAQPSDNGDASPAEADQVKTQQGDNNEKDDLALRPANMEHLDLNDVSPAIASAPLPDAEHLDASAISPKTSEAPVANSDSLPKQEQGDVEMTDAPLSSTKTVHERDESEVDEPSAKRTKTASPSQNGNSHSESRAVTTKLGRTLANEDYELTEYQLKELPKQIRAVKSTNDGKNFRLPVATLWPSIGEVYLSRTPNPMDLSVIEQRLKHREYKRLSDFVGDVELMYDNCVAFNGVDHDVTRSMVTVMENIYGRIPPKEPIKQEKKKGTATQRVRAPQERRTQYTGTGHGQSPYPPTGGAQTFALDPSGTPLIRRDSTKVDGGRPKREIHPPKPRDLVYNARPKKKKFAVELKFCEEVLNELKRPKYINLSSAFLQPVDPVALGIPDYFKIIKNPMDLQTIGENLRNGHYQTAKEFEADIRLMFRNCYRFNPEGTPVHIMGKDLEKIFDEEWAKKSRYMADHAPSLPASPDSSAESADEDESADDGGDADDNNAETINLLQSRLVDEQQKLITVMGSKNSNNTVIRMQQEMVALIQKELEAAKKTKAKKPKGKPAKAKKIQQAKRGTKAAAAGKAYKPKNIGQEEKEQISAGIVQLEGPVLDEAITLLKRDIPDLDLEENPELDIDQFTNGTLSRLHDLIQRHCPQVIPQPAPRAPRQQKQAKPKKNKPMSKQEQEKKIEQLRQLEMQFQRQGSQSDDVRLMQSVEGEQESSGDESSSDSEED